MDRLSFFIIIVLILYSRPVIGTIEEQRIRLPPPVECSDPIEGVWQSHAYDAPYRQWQQFTLEIHRDSADPALLYGSITNNAWDGDETMSEPGPCEGLRHFFVSMEASGTFNDQTNETYFAGLNWRLDHVYCGSIRRFGYDLDHFSGVIDRSIQEFQSVNNGGRAVNDPTVFRRIQCFEANVEEVELTPSPNVTIEPPSMYPRGGMGCNRRH